MFKEAIERNLNEPDQKDLGKHNIEEMERLVEIMTENGEYVDAAERKQKKIKKSDKAPKEKESKEKAKKENKEKKEKKKETNSSK